MSLKLLAIPLLVISILVIAISYVKPDLVLLSEKRRQLEHFRLQAASLDRISSNIKSMQTQIATSNSDPGSQVTDADFLRQVYFPAVSDIEKGIDQLNFLADQSGVAVSDIQVQDVEKKSAVSALGGLEDSASGSAELLIANESDVAVEAVPVAIHRTYTPDTFIVTIETVGSYEATKDFYARLVQAKRFFFPKVMKLANKDQGSSGFPGTEKKEDVSSDTLVSSVEVEFSVLPTVSVASAVGDEAFEKAKLDFETLAMIRQDQQGVTPALPAANTLGKTNLFVK